MRQVIAGIDLGTTNSVIAIPGQFPDQGIVFGNVTALWDDLERLTHASAVCQVDGELVVGDDAKALASEGYTPVRFVKKYIGTRKSFRLGESEESPEQVSAHVLRYLCQFAERSLGVKVVGAVITHPAYFDGVAISATRTAGELAGLRVAGLLMEPVAAAMAYCEDSENPNMRVLVYDLGGGTFDITLVERTGVAFRPKSFGGNRELGGYNFDKKIALAILQSLRAKGYVLEIDPEQPERDPRWATLMHYAEKIKFDISGASGTKATVRVPSVFKDNSTPPKAVQLNFTMTRAEFVTLISPEIEETIRETRKVLENARLKPEDVDLLVMVGGSSRISAIQERLRQEFGLDPQFDDDVLDLSVAVGAAIVASSAGTTEEGVTLSTIPEETDEETIVFSGRVEPTEKCPNVATLSVTVAGGRGGEVQTLTSEEGKFYLEVELNSNSDHELQFTVADPAGQVVFSHFYSVAQTDDPQAGRPVEPPKAMLPKAVSVETITGFSILANEGVNLPFKGTKSLQTLREVTEIPVNLYQEDIQLTTILLTGFSHPVPPNCRIDLEIEIGADYQMKATAVVPAVKIQKTQQVKLAPLSIPNVEELRSEFYSLRQAYESQLQNTPDGEQKARLGAEGDLLIEEIDALLNAEFPELLQAYLLIKKLFLLTKSLASAGGLSPPKSELDGKFSEAKELLEKAIQQRPAIREQGYESTIKEYEKESIRAYQNNDAASWRSINEGVDQIIANLRQASQGPGPKLDDIPAVMLLSFIQQEISETRTQANAKSSQGVVSQENVQRCLGLLTSAEEELARIDLIDEAGAKPKIIGVYQQYVAAAKQIIGVRADGDVVVGELN